LLLRVLYHASHSFGGRARNFVVEERRNLKELTDGVSAVPLVSVFFINVADTQYA
jgi:hypothetical protein